MDINHSPLSGYQTKKTETTRQTPEASPSSDTSRINDSSPSTGGLSLKLSELKEGQILKGQVIDHRYQEIKLQLEPGKQLITAKLTNSIPLSIGETASFQVGEDPSKQLVLKYIPAHTTDPLEATVRKALQGSNLPMTERNKAIAAELLNHRMPLDKQTMQTLVSLSFKNKEASPLTLVLMHKYHLPMTPSNIAQFESYQKGTHQLLTDLKALTQKLSDLLGQSEVTTASQALTNDPSISTSQFNKTVDPEQVIQRNTKLIEILLQQGKASDNVTAQQGNLLDSQELTLLKDQVEQKLATDPGLLNSETIKSLTGLSPELFSVLSSEVTQPDNLTKGLLSMLGKGTISLEDSVKILDYLNSKALIPQLNTADDTTVKQTMDRILSNSFDHSQIAKDSTPVITHLLGLTDLESLVPKLSELPNSEQVMEKLHQGNATVKEVLDLVRTQLPSVDMETARNLLSSPVYAHLLEEAFLHKWTITPEKAGKKDVIEELYRQLQDDLKEISHLANSIKDSDVSLQVKEPVNHLQDNLQFMKYLNEAFTYLQLPVQFKDQKAHTDLFVLSRKRPQKNTDDPVSVLLHLVMKHLGALNIHIQLANNQVQATFYPEDHKISQLLRENLITLTDALQNKGYDIKADIKNEYKKPDFCSDFIKQNAQEYNVQQFNFDIRT